MIPNFKNSNETIGYCSHSIVILVYHRKEAVAYLMKVSNIHYLCAGCDYGYFSSKVMFGHASLGKEMATIWSILQN